ncbi:MAG TPA: T9SS type A sorting domain-containing protein [Candidatus Kapabacteria bacterium]|nr:T9SS type A sorting domain-containing protein [Candidatus Kapabacteria bacterium]
MILIANVSRAQDITSPSAGDIIKARQGYKINYTGAPSTGIDAKFVFSSNNGRTWVSINSAPIANSGSIVWSIPPITSDSCYINDSTTTDNITWSLASSVGPFTVYSNLGVKFAVDYPDSSHATVHQDSTVTIKYSASHLTAYAPDTINVVISYIQSPLPQNFPSTDTLLKNYDAANLRNGDTETLAWVVPKTPTKVRVFISTTDHQASGGSIPLTIQGATINVLSPKGGDSIAVGSTDTIRWTVSDSVSNDTVTINYSPEGTTFTTIARKVPSWRGYYVWNVPQNIVTSSSAEIIISADGGFVNQQSQSFWLGVVNHTGVSEPSNSPAVYLDQNYPNPFSASGDNSVTNIPFSLSSPQSISLQVFDVLGREVFRSPAQFFNAGTHIVQFNAAQFLPGAYWYDVVAGTRSLTGSQRMMLYVR